MRLNHIRLREFRNVVAADLQLNGNRQFFHGLNGQGKTNLLEAAGLLSAARSFRTNEIQPLIRHNQPLAAVFAETKVNETPSTFIDIRLAKGRRTILVDEAKIDRYSDFIGRYPTVTISSADIQLLRAPLVCGADLWISYYRLDNQNTLRHFVLTIRPFRKEMPY